MEIKGFIEVEEYDNGFTLEYSSLTEQERLDDERIVCLTSQIEHEIGKRILKDMRDLMDAKAVNGAIITYTVKRRGKDETGV